MFVKIEEREIPLSRENDSKSPLDDASKLLLKAAAVMEKVGKCGPDNDNGIDEAGRLCAFHAINYAARGSLDEFVGAARKRLAAAIGDDEWAVMSWSDESTQDAVVAKLRAVALGL